MKKSKIFAALALSACMALGTTGLIACAPNNGSNGGNTGDTENKSIMRVYEAYVAAAEANGEDVLDYDEWYADLLANAKGEKGDKGEKGETGAKGDKGEKGETGAKGDKGDNGENGKDGKDGNGWLVGTTAPTAEQGNDGDLYLDYSTWNVYHKENGEWTLLGNIKGADGVGGGEQQPDVPASKKISISANGTTDMPISNISDGVHIIEADLGSAKLSTGRLQAKIGEGVPSELVFSATRSTEGHNVYYGFIKISEVDTAITFSAISESVDDATVVIKDWEVPMFTVGTPVEMPVYANGTANENLIKIKADSSFSKDTEYRIYIDGDSTKIGGTVKFYAGTVAVSITATNYNGAKTVRIDDDAFNDAGEIYFYVIVASSSAAKLTYPVTVTLTDI